MNRLKLKHAARAFVRLALAEMQKAGDAYETDMLLDGSGELGRRIWEAHARTLRRKLTARAHRLGFPLYKIRRALNTRMEKWKDPERSRPPVEYHILQFI